MEICHPKHREMVSSYFVIPWAVGYMMTAVFAYFIGDWRYLQIALTLPSLILVLNIAWVIMNKYIMLLNTNNTYLDTKFSVNLVLSHSISQKRQLFSPHSNENNIINAVWYQRVLVGYVSKENTRRVSKCCRNSPERIKKKFPQTMRWLWSLRNWIQRYVMWLNNEYSLDIY